MDVFLSSLFAPGEGFHCYNGPDEAEDGQMDKREPWSLSTAWGLLCPSSHLENCCFLLKNPLFSLFLGELLGHTVPCLLFLLQCCVPGVDEEPWSREVDPSMNPSSLQGLCRLDVPVLPAGKTIAEPLGY